MKLFLLTTVIGNHQHNTLTSMTMSLKVTRRRDIRFKIVFCFASIGIKPWLWFISSVVLLNTDNYSYFIEYLKQSSIWFCCVDTNRAWRIFWLRAAAVCSTSSIQWPWDKFISISNIYHSEYLPCSYSRDLTSKNDKCFWRIAILEHWQVLVIFLEILHGSNWCLYYCIIWWKAFILQYFICFIITGIKLGEHYNNWHCNNCSSVSTVGIIEQHLSLPFPVPTLEKKSSSALVNGLGLSIGMQYLPKVLTEVFYDTV